MLINLLLTKEEIDLIHDALLNLKLSDLKDKTKISELMLNILSQATTQLKDSLIFSPTTPKH